jgi:hypothetical protein
VDDVGVVEDADDLADGVGLADVGEELVAQSLAFGGALHDAGDVDEADGGRHLPCGVEDLGQPAQPRIGHADDTDVRLDGGERVVRGQHVVLRQGVEHRGLADVGQADDADGEGQG